MIKITAPFRWAGSKAKLTSELFNNFKDKDIYVEPFLGSGVVLFRLLQEKRYKKHIVNDVNVSIIRFYKEIKRDVESVITNIEAIKDLYNDLDNLQEKIDFYYMIREEFNKDKENYLLFWFLMKAGFNGLYRENRNGGYNAPSGKKEKITFNADMVREISNLIQDVEFYCMDYQDFYNMLETNKEMFIYNDPPYCKSQSYSAKGFNNKEFADFLENTKSDIAISDVDNEQSNSIYNKFTKIFIKDIKRVINIKSINTVNEVLYVNY